MWKPQRERAAKELNNNAAMWGLGDLGGLRGLRGVVGSEWATVQSEFWNGNFCSFHFITVAFMEYQKHARRCSSEVKRWRSFGNVQFLLHFRRSWRMLKHELDTQHSVSSGSASTIAARPPIQFNLKSKIFLIEFLNETNGNQRSHRLLVGCLLRWRWIIVFGWMVGWHMSVTIFSISRSWLIQLRSILDDSIIMLQMMLAGMIIGQCSYVASRWCSRCHNGSIWCFLAVNVVATVSGSVIWWLR